MESVILAGSWVVSSSPHHSSQGNRKISTPSNTLEPRYVRVFPSPWSVFPPLIHCNGDTVHCNGECSHTLQEQARAPAPGKCLLYAANKANQTQRRNAAAPLSAALPVQIVQKVLVRRHDFVPTRRSRTQHAPGSSGCFQCIRATLHTGIALTKPTTQL